METVKIRCENNGKEVLINKGSSLGEIAALLSLRNRYPFIAAYVNNRSEDLNDRIYEPKSIRFIDATHFEGARVYQRTLFFVLYKAVRDLYPEAVLKIQHSLGRGFYFVLEGAETGGKTAARLKERMHELVDADLPIERDIVYRDDAEHYYADDSDKLRLINTRRHLYVTVDTMADVHGYLYGTLAPSSGSVPVFDIRPFYDGFLLCVPRRRDPETIDEPGSIEKMFDVFSRHKEWLKVLDVSNIGLLNAKIIDGKASDLIKIGEAMQQRLFTQLSDTIMDRRDDGLKLILISGPSSSGKTTFSMRLNIELRLFGLKPVVLSMDNYFVDRDKTPIDEKGKHDFEALEAVDLELFNDNLSRLIAGEKVEIPKFDFRDGHRYYDGTSLELSPDSVIIVEGIHALNPAIAGDIPHEKIFRIYVSALTSISMDNLSRFSTTDNRLLRRIVRDSRYRNHTALETIRRWGSVRRGEEKNIFPYQEEADYMFNSSLIFEISMLKRYAEPLLMEVPDTEEEYSEASRLLDMLDFFMPLDDKEVPPTSIIREFIGGSSFKY